MSDETPDRLVMLDALALLGVPSEVIAAFPSYPGNLAASFAVAIVDAPATIHTDWRFDPSDVLNNVWQRLYPYGVKGMIEEEDDESGFPKRIILQHAGIGTRYRIRINSDEPDLNDILFALNKVLPGDVQIKCLEPWKGNDSYLHIVHPFSIFTKVRELLGDWFNRIFAVHDTKLAFVKAGGNVKPKRNLAKKWIKDAKEWLEQMQSMHENACSEIELNINCQDITQLAQRYVHGNKKDKKNGLADFIARNPLPRRFRLLQIDMHMYALRLMVEGTIEVLEGVADGWSRIHLGIQYELLSVRLHHDFGHGRNLDNDLVDATGRMLALAWALGDMKIVTWVSETLIRFPEKSCGWKFTPLEPMLLQLYALWRNLEIQWEKYPGAKLIPYRTLFDAWNNPEKLPQVLEIWCDYHCLRTGESDYQEFSDWPYQILPAEILAVYRLRELQGLATPTIAHELMDTPLGRLPNPVQSPPDDLLQRIIAAVKHDHPDFNV